MRISSGPLSGQLERTGDTTNYSTNNEFYAYIIHRSTSITSVLYHGWFPADDGWRVGDKNALIMEPTMANAWIRKSGNPQKSTTQDYRWWLPLPYSRHSLQDRPYSKNEITILEARSPYPLVLADSHKEWHASTQEHGAREHERTKRPNMYENKFFISRLHLWLVYVLFKGNVTSALHLFECRSSLQSCF